MDDPYNLERFVQAQDGVLHRVRVELQRGRKTSHWMWFVFPQIEGLGRSEMAERYAIRSLSEARAYLAHPLLGPRLIECTRLVLAVEGQGIEDMLGYPDHLKFRSSMTLFAHATTDNEVFMAALRKYFDETFDPATLAQLARAT